MTHLPRCNPGDLAGIDGDVLHLTLPMTPSQNRPVVWWEKRKVRETYLAHLRGQCGAVLGPRGPVWAQRAEISLIRCSTATRAADTANLIGGAKLLVDCFQAEIKGGNHRYLGAGLIPDDGPEYLTWGAIEDRPRGHWGGLLGPATHVYLKRLA